MVDGPHPPRPAKKQVVEPPRIQKKVEEAPIVEEVPVVEEVPIVEDAPIVEGKLISPSSTKAEIVAKVAAETGIDVSQLKALTKAQLLERFAQ